MSSNHDTKKVAEAVERERVVSMLRGRDRERMRDAAQAVLEGGLRLIMVTMTIPDAPRLLETLVSGGGEAIFGAGSVTTINEAVEMIGAGAAFVACPLIDKRIIDYCRDNGVYVAAGGLTPTEVMEANLAGADLVKVYPVAAVGGAEYVRFLLRPMPFLRLMPVGALNPEDVADYIGAGSVAVGASALPLDREESEITNMDIVRARAEAFASASRDAVN